MQVHQNVGPGAVGLNTISFTDTKKMPVNNGEIICSLHCHSQARHLPDTLSLWQEIDAAKAIAHILRRVMAMTHFHHVCIARSHACTRDGIR